MATPAPTPQSCAGVLGATDGRIAFRIWGDAPDAIATIHADGSAFTRIVEPAAGQEQHDTGNSVPRWTPTGDLLLDRATEPDGWHLFTVPAAGGSPVQITGGADGIEGAGANSPDGKLLAYQKVAATGDPNEPLAEAGLVTSRADGSHERQLTAVQGDEVDENPDFSPDGSRIAFNRELGGTPGSHRGSIWVVNVDGTGLHEITNPALDAIWPRWSPDGSWIAFSSNADNFATSSANVWLVRPDGTDAHQITMAAAGAQAFFPDWAPDGRHLVMLSLAHPDASQGLAVIGPDGAAQCVLWQGTSGQHAGDPDWGPPA